METEDQIAQRKADAETLLPQFKLERVLNTGKSLQPAPCKRLAPTE